MASSGHAAGIAADVVCRAHRTRIPSRRSAPRFRLTRMDGPTTRASGSTSPCAPVIVPVVARRRPAGRCRRGTTPAWTPSWSARRCGAGRRPGRGRRRPHTSEASACRSSAHGAYPPGRVRLDGQEPEALSSACVGPQVVTAEDVVFADDDGVLFVPAGRAEEVLATTREIWETSGSRHRIRAGETLREQTAFADYLERRAADPGLHLQAAPPPDRGSHRGIALCGDDFPRSERSDR